MDIFEILKAILQGIVQGITEWLPISSTGHMILINQFIPMHESKEFFDLFKVLIQLGSILAVVVLYFHKLNPWGRGKTPIQKRDTWILWSKVLVASIPAAVIGLLFDDVIEGALSRAYVIAIMLILYGVLFLIVEGRHREPKIKKLGDISYKTALLMGVFQMLALIPGTSRSGATIVGAIMIGCSRYVATEFSFFMAIPAMLGASGLKTVKYVASGDPLNAQQWVLLLVGSVVAFVVSLLVIRFLMNFIKKHNFKPFGYYRIALGALVLILFFTSLLPEVVTE